MAAVLERVLRMVERRATPRASGAKRARPPPVAEWVQCDACNKWRRLLQSDGALPERWTCELNTGDPARSRCDAPEERTIDSAVDEEHDDGDDEGAEPVAEAEGVPLHMSAVSATGTPACDASRGAARASRATRRATAATLGRWQRWRRRSLRAAVQSVRAAAGGGAAEGGGDEDASESEEEPKHVQCWQAAGGVGCFGCTLPLGHAGPHRTATDEGSRRRRAAPNRFAQPEGGPESEEAAEHERATQRRLDVRPQPPHPSRDERERRAERALRAAAAERLTLVESHKSNAGYARVTQRGERARPFAAEGLCPHTSPCRSAATSPPKRRRSPSRATTPPSTMRRRRRWIGARGRRPTTASTATTTATGRKRKRR